MLNYSLLGSGRSRLILMSLVSNLCFPTPKTGSVTRKTNKVKSTTVVIDCYSTAHSVSLSTSSAAAPTSLYNNPVTQISQSVSALNVNILTERK